MKQETLLQAVKYIIKTPNQNMLITGRAGLGKSFSVIKAIREIGLADDSFLYINGFFTPRALFDTLNTANQLNNPKLLIFDDIATCLRDRKIVELMKGMLWEVGGKRVASYFTNKRKEQIEVLSKIIIIVNEIPTKSYFNPIKDRMLCYNFEFSKQEINEIVVDKMIPEKHATIPYKKRLQIWQEIRDDENTSLRSYQKALTAFEFAGSAYKDFI